MGIIRRSFRHLNCKIFSQLFKSMVRPHLEYAATSWNPHLKKEIRKIESVQRRATKQVPELKTLNYDERLRKLNIPTLAYRRLRGDAIETYKMMSGRYDPQLEILLKPHKAPGKVTRGHSLKLTKPKCLTNLTKHFFTRRVVDSWNRLPEKVVSAPSIQAFENRLDKHWSRLNIKYDFDLAMATDHPFTATGGSRTGTEFHESP